MFANKTHEQAHEALKSGDILGSIELYSVALKESPNHTDILSDRGVAYLHAKEKELCFKDLNRAIELQPDYSFRYACRAYAKNHFGDLDGGIKDYEKAVSLDPEDAIAHNNLGMLLEQKGYMKQAQDRFRLADMLSDQEDGLLDMMQELENTQNSSQNINSNQHQNSLENDELDSTQAKEFKKVFTSKKQFEEFLKFIKNGFRIK